MSACETPTSNRKNAIVVCVLTGLFLSLSVPAATSREEQKEMTSTMKLQLLPYPQELKLGRGRLSLGPARFTTDDTASPVERVAMESLRRLLPRTGNPIPVRLGSSEEGYVRSWLTPRQRALLDAEKASPGSCVLTVSQEGITVVGKGKWGMLYGVQTVNQLVLAASPDFHNNMEIGTSRDRQSSLPCLTIRDWPDLPWRCLSPTLTWYSGWNRLEGYDLCNWSLDEWKWLVDWSLLHKCNAWAVCMYGYWPFTLPGFEESTLQVDSFFFDPATGRKTPWRFVHPNIKREFFPEVIRYANERGIAVLAYIGKNSFNGGYILHHPEANAGGAAEMLPFHPAFDKYTDAFIGRILESGFNGFVFEDPEAYHVPNQNEQCYETFWSPWAETYGFHSREETDQNKPPLGVHVEYYTWLFRQYEATIRRHAARLGRKAEIHLISHMLLSRIVAESRTPEERKRWLALMDEKQGSKVHYIVAEGNEREFVHLLGGDRVASLGGRGGSCTCAMRRIASVNNNWESGPMGTGVDWERDCQRRAHAAGSNGAMGYIFEWRLNEIYGYIAAQHLWHSAGVPGVNNDDQVGFLDYAYRVHYGDKVGTLVARAMDGGSNVNDAMVMEGVYGSQYPSTGQPLHRDFQLLAARADEAARLAWEAYRVFTGGEPSLEQPLYNSEAFRWNGYDPEADKLFKAETLRRLCVSTRRSQEMCKAALAHRLAERLAAEGAPLKAVIDQLDRAVKAAEENQRLYQINYDDDYDWTDGLCARLTDRIRSLRDQYLAAADARKQEDQTQPVPETLRKSIDHPLFIPWEKQTDLVPSTPEAKKPGFYLGLNLGLNANRDEYCLGVVFTVQVRDATGNWQTLFRRALDRNSGAWEHWEIPISSLQSEIRNPKSHCFRFLTDSYSRARDRSWPSWQWALWGQPELIEITRGGQRHVLYDFVEHIADTHPFLRLDADGKERPFDGRPLSSVSRPLTVGEDSTGATFEKVEPGLVEVIRRSEGRGWQWVEGFATPAPDLQVHAGDYRSYLGVVPSWWVYGGESGEVKWLTAPVPKKKETAVVFIGGTDYGRGKAEFWCDGLRLLAFDTSSAADARWKEGEVELRYYHGGDTRDERITYGLSGVFLLHLPATLVRGGKPLSLSVRMRPEGGGWFMLHGFHNAMRVSKPATPPQPAMPAIAAFTPHCNGAFGVTGADYTVDLPDLRPSSKR